MQTGDILSHRLHNQQLSRSAFDRPGEVVAWLGAVQAQDYSGAKWALGQRVPGATDASVERAFADGAILRTHLMRPTWHFVAPADIRWMLGLTGPRVNAVNAYYYRALGLDEAVFKHSQAVLTRALAGGRDLTRRELDLALQEAGIAAKGPGLAYLVMRAELDGLVCSGPRRGKQFTYVLLDERVPPTGPLDPDQALAELARRYFTGHGPATLRDFVWWSGLTAADARLGIELVGSHLARETIDGKTYWLSPSATPPEMPTAAYLLPNYDEYTIAYKERGAFFDAQQARGLGPRDREPFNHAIVVGGRVVGTWKATPKRDVVVVDSRLFVELSETEKHALAAAVERYGAFRGLPAVLS